MGFPARSGMGGTGTRVVRLKAPTPPVTAPLFRTRPLAGLDAASSARINTALEGALVRYQTTDDHELGRRPRIGTLLGVLHAGLAHAHQWAPMAASFMPASGDVVICCDADGLGGHYLVCHHSCLRVLDVLERERVVCDLCERYDRLDALVPDLLGDHDTLVHPYDCVEHPRPRALDDGEVVALPIPPRTLAGRMLAPRVIAPPLL